MPNSFQMVPATAESCTKRVWLGSVKGTSFQKFQKKPHRDPRHTD